jgi:hypothetical protein
MDLTTYIKEGHFEREVRAMTHDTKYHNLIYHASGRSDINAVKEFQRSVIEWLPTIKNYASVKKSDASHSADDTTGFHTLQSLRKDN